MAINIEESSPPSYRIGEVSATTGLSVDTLRYYEKLGLLPNVGRDTSGMRFYTAKDLSRLRFIQRSKAMHFSLDDIALLLSLRDDPQGTQPAVRELTLSKHAEVKIQLAELQQLSNELEQLLQLCGCGDGECGIIERLNQAEKE